MRLTKVCYQWGQRSSRIGYELYRNADGDGFLSVWVGDPKVHRWWAFTFYVYFRNSKKAAK